MAKGDWPETYPYPHFDYMSADCAALNARKSTTNRRRRSVRQPDGVNARSKTTEHPTSSRPAQIPMDTP